MFQSFSSVRLFGSQARGDSDNFSDSDVLVVERCPVDSMTRQILTDQLQKTLAAEPSIGWYSESKIRSMFADGDLFAWHIYRESKKIFCDDQDFLDEISPAPYPNALSDVALFSEILSQSENILCNFPQNANYEAGLLFMCTRNIAMAASWYLDDGPYFSRRSPFMLSERIGIDFPLSESHHAANMRSRVLAHRGQSLPHRDTTEVSVMAQQLAIWARKVLYFVRDSDHEHAS